MEIKESKYNQIVGLGYLGNFFDAHTKYEIMQNNDGELITLNSATKENEEFEKCIKSLDKKL